MADSCHWVAQVAEFHRRFGQPVLERPAFVPVERIELRQRLIDEEFHELYDALVALNNAAEEHETSRVALEDVADSLVDLIYVCIGTAHEFGIPMRRVWDAVHAANMAKEAAPNGMKAIKPPGWKPPDIAGALWPTTPDGSVESAHGDTAAVRPSGQAALHSAQPPGDRYMRIGEVAKLLGVENHVVRYWEETFCLRADRTRKGQRVFSPEKVAKLQRIRDLLYTQKFTIAGAKRVLRDEARELKEASNG